MSSVLQGVEGQSQCNTSSMDSSASLEYVSQNGSRLKEHNYFGLCEFSLVDSSTVSSMSQEDDKNLNLKATDLRLVLPGSHSPGRDSDITPISTINLDENPLFPLVPSIYRIRSSSQKIVVSGSKRGFSDTKSKGGLFSEENWMFNARGSDSTQENLADNSEINVMLSKRPPVSQSSIKTEVPVKTSKSCHNNVNVSNTNIVPAAKTQIVGWPPIRSFRKNSLTSRSKNNDEVDGKPGPGGTFVKVSLAAAPYLRKVDLRTYSSYEELSFALEKMFSCFTIGQCGPPGAQSREILSEGKLRDRLYGSEYVLTYEDKDGDWMLVGDVPWEMFITSCKKLKIMKGSDAIGLAPGAVGKCKSPN
ncbi:auxin-responsive protein IAA9-like isoform X1 [Primulina eburnea]|uniref:auxin-responsive protein IAA9-like isoform X1 n=2 Tax=Primulina eburnea TaxID=1245227 RepID=UPI003C6C683C